MTEMDAPQVEMDSLLRRTLAAPAPALPKDFDARLMRELRRRSRPMEGPRRFLFAGYGLSSALVCAAIMRGQGLPWGEVIGMTLAPVALAAAVGATWRAVMTAKRQHAA
jgi:hypothetical protein